MKSLRNKVILSAVVLAFALIATIGSTYAWFTVSNTVNVESMTLNVLSSDSILIRVEDPTTADASEVDLDVPSTYKTSLTNADITTYYDYVTGTWKLQPVTAVNLTYTGVDGKLLNNMVVSDSNLIRDLSAVVGGDKNSATGKYIQLKFWLYSQSATSQAIVFQDLAITNNGANNASQANVVSAIRLAVWGDSTAYGNSTVGNAFIFGLDHDYGFAFTDSQLPGYYSGVLADPIVIDTDAFNALSQLNGNPFSANMNDLFYASNATTWDSSITDGAATATKGSADTIFTLQSMVPTLFTVNIYVEGWDAQTTNDIIAAAFGISFKFALKTA